MSLVNSDSQTQTGTVTAQANYLPNPDAIPVVTFNRTVGEECWIIQRNRVKRKLIEEITSVRTIEGDETRIKLKNVRKSLEVQEVFFSRDAAREAFFQAHLDEDTE